MKKIILIAVVSLFSNILNAQLIKKVNAGAVLATVAETSFSGSSKPFTVNQNLLADVTFITEKTFHKVMYGFGNNSLVSLNGYFLKKNWDVYGVFAKSLNSKGKYLGVGVEKMEKVGNIKIFEFCELGTTFQGKPILSFGILINASWSLKK